MTWWSVLWALCWVLNGMLWVFGGPRERWLGLAGGVCSLLLFIQSVTA